MAELTLAERLQPALLDRLTDDEPTRTDEPRERRVVSLGRLREAVQRDLAWLLDCVNLDSVQDLSDYPAVASSVVNYGLPDLAGRTASGTDVATVERLILQAIQEFEPRLLRSSLRVRAVAEAERAGPNSLAFEVEGELWAQPLPVHLFLRTEVDLEIGSVTVTERGGRGPG